MVSYVSLLRRVWVRGGGGGGGGGKVPKMSRVALESLQRLLC